MFFFSPFFFSPLNPFFPPPFKFMNCHYVCLTCFVCDVTEEVNVETSAISFTLVPAYCMSTLLPRLFTSLRPDRFDCFNVEKNNKNKNSSFMQWVWLYWQVPQGWNQRWLHRTLWWWIKKNVRVYKVYSISSEITCGEAHHFYI